MEARTGVCSSSGRVSPPCSVPLITTPISARQLRRSFVNRADVLHSVQRCHRRLTSQLDTKRLQCRAAAADVKDASVTSSEDSVYPLEKTKVLVETAMLAAVSGLAYLLSTLLRLDTTLGYFLPLPVVLASFRGGPGAGWRTMMATCFLLVVLLGPLRAVSYLLIHGLLAASLGHMWVAQTNFWLSAAMGGLVRMAGQFAYLILSSLTMGENIFAIMMSNVYAMLDQICASIGMFGSPSPLAISCTLFGLVLVNSLTYTFLLQVIYRVMLQMMGFKLGPLPKIVAKYLYAGMPDPDQAQRQHG